MGRIKSKQVRRIAKNLVSEEEIEFTADFEKNKEFLKNLLPSKKIRNQVAGQIVRLKKKDSQKT